MGKRLVGGLFSREQALDLLQARSTERARENPFFLEAEMVPRLGESSQFVGLARIAADRLPHRIVDRQEFEDSDPSEVASALTTIADNEFNRISFRIDSLFGWRWNGWVVQLVDSPGWDSEFLQELWGGLIGLFALVAQATDQSLVQDPLHDLEECFGMFRIGFQDLNDGIKDVICNNASHSVFLFLVDLIQECLDDFVADQGWHHEDIGLLESDFLEHRWRRIRRSLFVKVLRDINDFGFGFGFVLDGHPIPHELVSAF